MKYIYQSIYKISLLFTAIATILPFTGIIRLPTNRYSLAPNLLALVYLAIIYNFYPNINRKALNHLHALNIIYIFSKNIFAIIGTMPAIFTIYTMNITETWN